MLCVGCSLNGHGHGQLTGWHVQRHPVFGYSSSWSSSRVDENEQQNKKPATCTAHGTVGRWITRAGRQVQYFTLLYFTLPMML